MGSPYQVGFSMNMAMAMTIDFSNAVLEDITIEDVFSATGLVYGLALWYESTLNFRGELNVNRLVAGFHVDGDYARNIDYESLPNKAMEACAVRLYDDTDLPLSMKETTKLKGKERDASEITRLIANKGEQYMVC